MCLFHVLLALAEELHLTLHPVHVNHKLRQHGAEADQAYVEALCRQKGLSCRTFAIDCAAMAEAEKLTAEEAGRKARYRAFAQQAEELIEAGVCRREQIRIAVAQNADDQAETILFRILRGAGVDGLSGMRYKRFDEDGNLIIRPLLDVYKEEVLDYCARNELRPCTDQTNLEPTYTRNKIRLELIPALEKEYNRRIKDTMIRMGESAAMDSDCLWQSAEKAFDRAIKHRSETGILLDGDLLRNLHEAVFVRVLAKTLGELGLHQDLTHAHYQSSISLLWADTPSARLDLPKGYYLTRVYGDLKAVKPSPRRETKVRITVMPLSAYRARNLPARLHAVFDLAAFAEEHGEGAENRLVLDVRDPGDFLPVGKKAGEAGFSRKKIQNLFVDQKIPRDLRDEMKLLKIGNEVLWVLPGDDAMKQGRYTAKYKLCEATKKVICVEIIC